MNISVRSNSELSFNGKTYRCALGKGGVGEKEKEGDGITPLGCFPIRKIYYRADKLTVPESPFTMSVLSEDDGWCDDVNLPQYNQHVQLPFEGSHENLWRDDNIYDIIVVLGYNNDPVVPGKGSAIFMHVAQPDYTPTAGCVALALPDLLEVLAGCSVDTKVCIER